MTNSPLYYGVPNNAKQILYSFSNNIGIIGITGILTLTLSSIGSRE